jgi:hypothetical protein
MVEVWRAYVEPDGDGRIHVAAGGGSGHREQRNGQSEHGEFGELGRAEEGRERHEHGEEEGRDELHRVPDEEGNRWQSSGKQVAIKWQSSGNPVAIQWQSSGNQVAIYRNQSQKAEANSITYAGSSLSSLRLLTRPKSSGLVTWKKRPARTPARVGKTR